jgi:uncharacterized membrane protein YdfJ with MMPL/SSD domain
MFARLAALIHRRPRRILLAAVTLAVIAGVLGGSVANRLSPYGADDPSTGSVKAQQALEAATGLSPDVELIALVSTPAGPAAPATRFKLARVAREIGRNPAVGRIHPPRSARDGRSAFIGVNLRTIPDKAKQDAAKEIRRTLTVPGVKLGGFAKAAADVNHTVEHDIRRAELLAFPLLFALSLLFFRSLIASALPLLVGGLAIVGTFFVLRVLSGITDISIFALNLTTGLGLGLAIDYSLFIVARYREEVARSGAGPEALRRTLDTAGRTVMFSSLTVAAALASLLVFPQRFLYSMGAAGSIVALLAATVALIVLPAILALLGERINGLSPRFLQRRAAHDVRPDSAGAWYRLSRLVMRRPIAIALTSATVLVIAGLPFLGIKFTSIDSSVLPKSAESRQTSDALHRDFPPNRTEPMYVTVAARGPQVKAYAARVGRLPGAEVVSRPKAVARDLSVFSVISRYRALDARSEHLVRDVRAVPAPAAANVGGRTAAFVDLKHSLTRHLGPALAIVVAATFAVLFLMTGSVVLPIKAVLMNVLTLSAAFGILVFVFQDGRLESVLGYTSQGAIEASMPVLLFAVAFGLSTDYGVFLLGRIKEARDNGASDTEAVAIGLERTGRIITSAALLLSIAIGAFATSGIIFIKENGVGTAAAILIDATIVRALLVPSLMALLGRRNWWAPGPLRRLHRRIGLSEAPQPSVT